ncbi:MAG: DNA translocase FtsK 4TM domain-containing protein [Candidatus Zixiibacteriota bacterium]
MAGKKRNKNNGNDDKRRKLLGVLLILLAFLIFTSLVTHSTWDDRMFTERNNPFKINFRNQVGTVGAISSYYFYFFLGWLSFFVPFISVLAGLKQLKAKWLPAITPGFWYICVISILITMITDVYKMDMANFDTSFADYNGGYIFFNLTKLLMKVVGHIGSVIILGAGAIALLIAFGYAYPSLKVRTDVSFNFKFGRMFNGIGKILMSLITAIGRLFQRREKEIDDDIYETEPIDALERYKDDDSDEVDSYDDSIDNDAVKPRQKRRSSPQKLKIAKKPSVIGRETKDYIFPGLDLLTDNPYSGPAVSPDELNQTAEALRETLKTFNVRIDGNIEKFPGPVITRFEFKPAAGIKVNQILNLSDDLALALKAKRIRIVAPIPGKAAVGIEIPNRTIRIVYLKDIFNSEIFGDPKLRLPLALGKTISGRPFVTDLAKMPHLLVAGATNSGKSVCINTIITSLMYRLHPEEVKLILIDPKMLELSVYAGIPYLGRPVVTHPKRAEKVLSDAVGEMEIRYKKLAKAGVRNIVDYNEAQKTGEEKMPYIVIIIDELADMMMSSDTARMEMLLTRLAQMARAVGIHLILATQRPSVDVITGLIKSNFPARIAFHVATRIDSKTILDGNGAEKLLGNGDMLFMQPGQAEPVRLHGALISGTETNAIVKFITDQFPVELPPETSDNDDVEEEDDPMDEVDWNDPVLVEAARTVIRHKQGSVSILQRKLGIGYQRASRMIDNLEKAGIVAAYAGSKARDVLVEMDYLEKIMASRSLTNSNS